MTRKVGSRKLLLCLSALQCAIALGLAVGVRGSERECLVPPMFEKDAASETALERDRSPVDVVLTPDERYLLTANQTSGTVSLVKCENGKVVCEVPCGRRPSAIALTPDGSKVLVTATWSGELWVFERREESLKQVGSLWLGFEPRGIAVSPDGSLAYVALTTSHDIAVVDLKSLKLTSRIAVGKWPRYLALSPDGKRLAVGVSGDGGVTVVDTKTQKSLYTEDFVGINLGQMQVSHDGKFVYFPWMIYRQNPITTVNIQKGWVLASRIARVRLDTHVRREAISLDKRGEAVADPLGLALSPDEKWIACSAGGTHELLMFKADGLPFQDYGGPGDHIDANLLKDSNRFYRIPLGGRPTAARFARDGRRVFVANYLSNSIQVVDIVDRKVTRTYELGGPATPSIPRRGEVIFYDGKRSLDQWYSCSSCHYEGHGNSVTMDTKNDGRFGNFKTVLSLRNVTHTGPWFWHGWQNDLHDALKKSLVDTMLGPEPKDADVNALAEYFKTLEPPPNPNRGPSGKFSAAALRGEAVFRGDKAGCANCHSGPYYTDGKIHDVGTGERGDVYHGYNPPSLLGVYDRIRYLHDGRAGSLEEVLKGPHNPSKVTGNGELTERERADLLAFLREL